MNTLIMVVQNGDNINDLIESALDVVKVKTVGYVVLTFNECKLFIVKSSTQESVIAEYKIKTQPK